MMDSIIVDITKKEKSEFIQELLSSFDYVQIRPNPEKKISSKPGKHKKAVGNRVKELRNAFEEIELHIQGKKKLKTLDEVLNEL